MNADMEQWAKERVDRFAEHARQAENVLRTAERDLEGIKVGRPSGACLKRYWNWRGCQPAQR